MTWQKWLQPAAVDDGARPGQSRTESVELREARKRIRLLEQEYEVLRRAAAYLSQANLPGKGSTRSRKSSPLTGSLSRWHWGYLPQRAKRAGERVLKLSRQSYYYRSLANPITDSEVVEAYRANALFDAHRDDPEFGQCLGADGRWWKTRGEGSDLLSLGRGLHRGGGGPHCGITRAASRRCPGRARGCQLTPRRWRDLGVDAWLRRCALPGHR